MYQEATLTYSTPIAPPAGRGAARERMANELHNDAAWLAAYRRGDADALSRLYERYAPELRDILKKGLVTRGEQGRVRIQLREADEQEEVVQEVFARVFSETTRRNYQGVAPFFPYLSRICRNVVVDRFHRQRREAQMFRSDVMETPSGQWSYADRTAAEKSGPVAMGQSPERRASRAALADLLSTFLSTLNDEERALLTLYYEDDASQRDAAERLGISRQRVRTVVGRLRRRLLKHLRQHGWIEDLDVGQLLHALALLAAAGGCT